MCWPLAERSPQPMLAVDGSHLVRYANPAFYRLLGKQEDEVLGLRYDEVVPSIVGVVSSSLIDRVFETGNQEQQTEKGRPGGIVGVPGSNWLLSMWAVPDEQPLGVMIHVTDLAISEALLQESTTINEALLLSAIREHELAGALAESEERYRALYGALPVAAFLCDCNAVIQNYNPRAAELWGREPLIGVERHCGSLNLYLMDGTPMPHSQSPIMSVLRTGLAVRNVEVLMDRPDGTRIPVTVNFSALRDPVGEIVGAVTSFDDISERIEAERAMLQAQAELTELAAVLEERVQERTAELMFSNDELEGFTYSVAHDLRQQIRGVSINAAIVLADAGEVLDAQNRDLLRRLEQSAKQLGKLVDDLLGYARLARLEPEKKPFDLSELAREVSRQVVDREYCSSKTQFSVAPGLTARGDPTMVKFALENLIDNACKYSALTAEPLVEVGQDEQGFFVRDNGIGFDMAYVHKLFQPFERLLRGNDYPGTGIGLANVKRIVEKHGGRVWADSEPGEGSTFHFTLAG